MWPCSLTKRRSAAKRSSHTSPLTTHSKPMRCSFVTRAALMREADVGCPAARSISALYALRWVRTHAPKAGAVDPPGQGRVASESAGHSGVAMGLREHQEAVVLRVPLVITLAALCTHRRCLLPLSLWPPVCTVSAFGGFALFALAFATAAVVAAAARTFLVLCAAGQWCPRSSPWRYRSRRLHTRATAAAHSSGCALSREDGDARDAPPAGIYLCVRERWWLLLVLQ
jgi:hypothetical protein